METKGGMEHDGTEKWTNEHGNTGTIRIDSRNSLASNNPYYPANGRPSVDPVSMFKMLLVGYLYGIKSERRLVQEVQLNIAYRWFCGFELADKIPDHSTFSKTRLRKWNQSQLFRQVF